MNTKLVRFTKYMLDAMFYIGIVLTAAIPVLFYFFGNYTQQEIADLYGHCKSTAWHYIHSALQMLQREMEGFSHGEY